MTILIGLAIGWAAFVAGFVFGWCLRGGVREKSL